MHSSLSKNARQVATYASVPGILPALENMVSRKHAVLRVDNGQLQLMDLGAVNKT